jgi:hypothetical protein
VGGTAGALDSPHVVVVGRALLTPNDTGRMLLPQEAQALIGRFARATSKKPAASKANAYIQTPSFAIIPAFTAAA